MKLSSDAVTELAKLRSNIAAMQKDEKELTKELIVSLRVEPNENYKE